MEFLVRRPDGHHTPRTHVRLPAALSQRRRRGRDRRAAGARRFGSDPRPIFRAALLGRHRRRQLHDLSIYRRAVPLSGQRAGASQANALIACGFAAATDCSADIWKKFQDRFVIPRILEFYASTEGNVSLYNVEGKVGVDRPRSAVPRLALSAGAGAIRPGDRTAGARRRRLLHPLRRERDRRSDRPNA